MPRKKKPFIAKGAGTHYSLVHRSLRDVQADGSDSDDENALGLPSVSKAPFVLVHAGVPLNEGRAPRAEEDGDEAREKRKKKRRTKADHVNELGLPNDGYDYKQHLAPIGLGGGNFVGTSGETAEAAAAAAALARRRGDGRREAAAAGEVRRDLDSIVLADTLMEPDVRDALRGAGFDDGDGEDMFFGGEDDVGEDDAVGGFEAFDDDWISGALAADKAPEGDGSGAAEEVPFDFDAHVANLIARSKGRKFDSDSDDEEFNFRESDYGSDSDADADADAYADADAALAAGAAAPHTSEERALADAQFDALLGEYQTDSEGEYGFAQEEYTVEELDAALDAAESDDDGGSDSGADLEGVDVELHRHARTKGEIEDNPTLDAALDDFLESQRAIGHATAATEGRADGGDLALQLTRGVSKEAAKALRKAKRAAENGDLPPGAYADDVVRLEDQEAYDALEFADAVGELVIEDESFAKEYMEKKARNPWDCESIVSTRSNLDNHPKMLGASRDDDDPVERKRRAKAAARRLKRYGAEDDGDDSDSDGAGMAPIVLSKKTGLPIVVEACGDSSDDDGTVAEAGENLGVKRNVHETKAEKKARKDAVKADRHAKRELKKTVKQMFKDELLEAERTRLASKRLPSAKVHL